MGAATITTPSNQFLAQAGKENVVLTTSDDDYYDSIKFKALIAAKGSIMENDKRNFCVAISGRRVTIHSSGLSSNKVCLTLYGAR